MGVLQNIYCFTKEPIDSESLQLFTERLAEGQSMTEPLLMGPAIYPDPNYDGRLISPDHVENSLDLFQAFTTIQDAVKALINLGTGLVSMRVLASYYRRAPEHFYDYPAGLGIYLLPKGYDLVIGEPEDFSDLAEELPDLYQAQQAAPVFDGKVFWCIWLQGKNAPILEDFLDSPMHKELTSIWPNATILDDSWL